MQKARAAAKQTRDRQAGEDAEKLRVMERSERLAGLMERGRKREAEEVGETCVIRRV